MILFWIQTAGILTMWVPARWALTAFQVAILCLAAYRCVVRWRQGRGIGLDPSGITLTCIIAWGAVQLAAGWTVDAFRTQEVMLDWTVNLAAFALALELSDRTRETFLTWMLAFATLLSILAMLTAFSSPPGVIAWWLDVGTNTATLGPFVYRNQYAAFVEALLPLALVRAFLDRERTWLYVVAAGLLFASVIAAGSRTGAALCLAEVLFIPLLMGRRGAWRAILGIATSVAALTLVAGWEPLYARFQEPNPYGLRWNLVQSSLEMIKQKPLTGWGLGVWSEVYPGFALFDDGSFVNQAHSDWAQWTVEGGVPFLALVIFLLVRVLRPAWRSVWGLGIIIVFAHCLVDYPMQQRPALATFFFVMLGMVTQSSSLRSHLKSGPPTP
ncbi:MAG: O-antigen ligase family protein [Bryobacteraceae bacterium]